LGRLVPILERVAASAMELAIILLPLAVYLLVLGMGVNRSRRPTAVAGPYSFALLLLGMSGFLLLGPPSWIAHLFRPQGATAYWVAYALYVFALIMICSAHCLRQRHSLVIYNIDPDQLGAILEEVLAAVNVPYNHTPGRISFANGRLLLDIETSALWSSATLSWRGKENGIRETFETNLRKALHTIDAGPNAASLFLTLLAVVLIAFMMFATGVFVLFQG
jgi:hypothetical protein